MSGILVSGVTGLVGRFVLEALLQTTDEEVHALTRRPLPAPFDANPRIRAWQTDLSEAERLTQALREARPAVVIHPAAIADVDACERDHALARAANVEGAANLARASAAVGAHFIHVSTDYVFDGSQAHPGPYDETAPVHPVNYYGETKLEAERLVSDICAGRVGLAICRTALVYGLNPTGRTNFIVTIANELRAGRRIRAVTDQQNTPTPAANLAEMLVAAARQRTVGLFNTAGGELITRYALAQAVADHFKLDASLITPLLSADLGQLARRPLLSGLRVDKAERELGVRAWNIKQGLDWLKSLLDVG
ncbi:MAG TPA: SDR family oxidoreductase [Ktedonobacterales bacterium]|nr:SDR family oxidoreductase [Ktedonobacterales bacterium]